MSSHNPIARDLGSAKYRQRVVNGSARHSWPEEFELGGRDAIHQATLDAEYHAERLEELEVYCAARTLRDGARR